MSSRRDRQAYNHRWWHEHKSDAKWLSEHRAKARRRYAKLNPTKRVLAARKWAAENAAYRRSYAKKYRSVIAERTKQWRIEALAHYGNKCKCCGETEPLFLTFDHVKRDGKREPKHERSGHHLVRKMRKLGYPKTIRLLCYNCNCGRERNGGRCPHKKKVRKS